MLKQVISSSGAPAAIGPYSQAVKAGNMLFLSGQIPLDPQTGEVVGNIAAEQALQVLNNIHAVLQTAGASLEEVVKTTIFLTDMADFGEVNKVYSEFFSQEPPARSTVQVAALPKGVKVEIEAVVVLA